MADMENNPGAVCPHCGWPVDPGDRFCGECAKPIPAAAAKPKPADSGISEESTTAEPVGRARSADPDRPPVIVTGGGKVVEEPAKKESSTGVWRRMQQTIGEIGDLIAGNLPDPLRSGEEPVPEERSGCGTAQPVLEVDAGRVMLEGLHGTLRVRVGVPKGAPDRLDIQAEGDGEEDGDALGLRYRKTLRGLEGGRWRDVSVSWRVPVGGAGMRTVRWEISFGGVRFEGESEHTVYPADADANGLRQVVLNIQQGHAGDVNVGNLLDGTGGMTPRELIDRIAKAPPRWVKVQLWPIDTFGPPVGLPAPPAEARTDRLTLRLGARRLHLLSGETVHLGRNRENEAVLRCLDTEGNLLRGRSLQISGSHATIRRNGGTAVCADHSSNGSLLDGESLHQAETPLTAGEEHRLGLGLCDGDVALSLCLHPFGCAVQVPVAGFCPAGFCDRRQASGVFLGRRDEVPEDYALVWCHVGLASCRPGWPDLSIWRIDGAFAWRSERGTGWLVPDLPLPLPDGGACPVEAFNQFGLQSSQSQENRSGENKR